MNWCWSRDDKKAVVSRSLEPTANGEERFANDDQHPSKINCYDVDELADEA